MKWRWALASMCITSTAYAHPVTISRGEYALHADTIDAELSFTSAANPSEETLKNGLVVIGEGHPCAARWEPPEHGPRDTMVTRAHFTCEATGSVVFRFSFLAGTDEHLVRVTGDALEDTVATGSKPEVRVTRQRRTDWLALVWLGIGHIFSGWDHLAFLLGLVITFERWRSLLGAITAFTIAHTITLGLAVFGVIHVAPSIVEPVIALSVVYVGIENLFSRASTGRWRITFPFGLIHGLGFAGALEQLDMPRVRLPVALFSFNAGVEIGQLAILCAIVPVLLLLRKSRVFRSWGVRVLSAAIAGLGVVWFVSRVI